MIQMFKNNSYHWLFITYTFIRVSILIFVPKRPDVLIINTLHNFVWFYTNKPDHLRRCEEICKV